MEDIQQRIADLKAIDSRRRLYGDLKALWLRTDFTATRIGEPGCKVRMQAEQDKEVLEAAMLLVLQFDAREILAEDEE